MRNFISAAVLSIAALLFSAAPARAQITFQVRDATGAIIHTYTSGQVILKCDTTMLCSFSGVTTLMTPNASAGGNIVSFNLTGTTAPIVNFSHTTPSIPAGDLAVTWQHDSGTSTMNASGYLTPCVSAGGSHAPGLVTDPGASLS